MGVMQLDEEATANAIAESDETNNVDGKIGYYAMAAETSISAGTWEAARAASNVALSAAQHIADGARSAFALCRPPGHHAERGDAMGFCLFNNIAHGKRTPIKYSRCVW